MKLDTKSIGVGLALAGASFASARPGNAQMLSDLTPPALTSVDVSKQAEGPSFEELAQLSTPRQVEIFYALRGQQFSDINEMLRQFAQDWLTASINESHRIMEPDYPDIPEPISLTVDGQDYEIHGIVHVPGFREEYANHFEELFGPMAEVLTEQNLGPFAKKNREIQIADHALVMHGEPDRPIAEMGMGALAALNSIVNLLPFVEIPSEPLFFALADKKYPHAEYFAIDRDLLEAALSNSEQGTLPSIDNQKRLEFMKRRPHELVYEHRKFPVGFSLELKEILDKPLDSIEARSAYMAEVLRHWDEPGVKRIVVGAAHASEIAYFLRNPTDDQEIQQMAKTHADKINQSVLGEDPLQSERSNGAWVSIGVWGTYIGVLLLADAGLGLLHRRRRRRLETRKAVQKSAAEDSPAETNQESTA